MFTLRMLIFQQTSRNKNVVCYRIISFYSKSCHMCFFKCLFTKMNVLDDFFSWTGNTSSVSVSFRSQLSELPDYNDFCFWESVTSVCWSRSEWFSAALWWSCSCECLWWCSESLVFSRLQGHYRFCDALFYLGEHQRALTANRLAQDACGADTEGQKDLLQQHERFQTELQESKGNVWSFSTASAASHRSGALHLCCVSSRDEDQEDRNEENFF